MCRRAAATPTLSAIARCESSAINTGHMVPDRAYLTHSSARAEPFGPLALSLSKGELAQDVLVEPRAVDSSFDSGSGRAGDEFSAHRDWSRGIACRANAVRPTSPAASNASAA